MPDKCPPVHVQVTGQESLKWQQSPVRCTADTAGLPERCDRHHARYLYDDEYMWSDLSTVYELGVVPGDVPTMLASFSQYTQGRGGPFFLRKTDGSYTTIIDATPARIRKSDGSINLRYTSAAQNSYVPTTGSPSPIANSDTWGQYVDVAPALNLINYGAGSSKMYALFSVTGNLRVGSWANGKVSNTKIVKYDLWSVSAGRLGGLGFECFRMMAGSESDAHPHACHSCPTHIF